MDRLLAYARDEGLLIFAGAGLSTAPPSSSSAPWSDALPYLETARKLAIQLGNEPRRARLDTDLIRFYAWKERPEDSDAMFAEGSRIAERLGMRSEQRALQERIEKRSS